MINKISFTHSSFNMMSLLLLTFSLHFILYDYNTKYPLESLQKLIILTTLIPVIIKRGFSTRYLIIIYAFLILLVLSMVKNHNIDMTYINRFIGLSLPWIVLAQIWTENDADKVLAILPKLSIYSLGFGILLDLLNIYDVFYKEYTGVYRLQGALIPAHLAFLGFTGIIASTYNIITGRKKDIIYLYINMAITALSFSRMALILSLAVYLYLYLFFFKKTLGKGLYTILSQVLFLGFIVSLTLIAPVIIQRTFSDSDQSDLINTSGRSDIWSVFYEEGMKEFWFGHGLGTVQYVKDNFQVNNLSAPHNEYINFFYDSGITGLTLFSLALLILLFKIKKRIVKEYRLFYIYTFILILIYALTDNAFNTLQLSLPFVFFTQVILTKSKCQLN